MRERFRSFDSKISFFAFADIITAVSGMLIFITLLLATDVGRPTNDQRSAAEAGLERQLKDTLTRQAEADIQNRNLQQLLAAANTAPSPEKLQSDISRLRSELADEQSKHAGIVESLAASKTALVERDKLLGITGVEEQIQNGKADLDALAREDNKVRQQTAALERQITSVQSKILKLRSREGQLWMIPDRSSTAKEPILAITSGDGLMIERFNHPEETQKFSKSRAHSGFEEYLSHAKSTGEYIVFLIRPSGIGLFKDLVELARAKDFEVGFDALEENKEVHFTAPPPIDDQAFPSRNPSAAPGAPTSAARTVNPIESNASPEPAVNPAPVSSTNTSPPPPPVKPPPPKPKSWWQRFLEWLGI